MDLYASPMACSLASHIAVLEAGLPVTIHYVNTTTKKTDDGADYRKIAPNGYVPALKIAEGQILTEGPAIVQWIADQRPETHLAPANGTLGSCGRNSGRRPGLIQLDLNLLKEFKLHGTSRIQARWEIFNVTNRVNLGGFQSSSVRSSVFGTIASTPDVDRGNPVIAQGGPRAMQWAVKVLF